MNNQATITAIGVTSGFPLTALSSIASFLVHPLADLSLTKTVSNPTPNVGDTITYTVKLAEHWTVARRPACRSPTCFRAA